jgi:hypothetical protein
MSILIGYERALMLVLNKKYAKYYIKFEPNEEMCDDGWFVNINYYNKKDDKLIESLTILKPEVDNVKNALIRLGWNI